MPGDVALVFYGDCQGRRIVLGWRLLLYRFPSRQIGYVAILAQGSFDGGHRCVARDGRLNRQGRFARARIPRDAQGILPGGIEQADICAGSNKELADDGSVEGRRQHERRLALGVARVEVVPSVDVDLDCALGARPHGHSEEWAQDRGLLVSHVPHTHTSSRNQNGDCHVWSSGVVVSAAIAVPSSADYYKFHRRRPWTNEIVSPIPGGCTHGASLRRRFGSDGLTHCTSMPSAPRWATPSCAKVWAMGLLSVLQRWPKDCPSRATSRSRCGGPVRGAASPAWSPTTVAASPSAACSAKTARPVPAGRASKPYQSPLRGHLGCRAWATQSGRARRLQARP